jgi:hypothetical protein
MGKIIILKDGTSKPIIEFNDVTDIIRDNLGDDIVECINEEIDDWSYDLESYHDMYDEASKSCQNYVDAIFKAQIEIEKVINLIKDNPDKNSECAVKSLTELKEMLEET